MKVHSHEWVLLIQPPIRKGILNGTTARELDVRLKLPRRQEHIRNLNLPQTKPAAPLHPVLKGPLRLLAQERGPDLVGDERHPAPVLNVSAFHDDYLYRQLAKGHGTRRDPDHIEERFRHGAAWPLTPAAWHLVRGIKLRNDPIQGREV